MARPLRPHAPGIAAHIVARGNDKQCIFTDDVDYERFLVCLREAFQRFDVRCHAFCAMWNHFHLLVTPESLPISRMMQHLNSRYCQWFNRRHGRVGHVLQGRFGCRLVDEGSYFLNALRYIALNPVEANRVSDPGEWRWSSYRSTAGLSSTPHFLALDAVWRALDATHVGEGQERYKEFVGAENPWQPSWLLLDGSTAFRQRLAPLLQGHRETWDFTYADRFAARPPLNEILAGATSVRSRNRAVRDAFLVYAYTLREIGAVFEHPPATIWNWIQRARRG